jgi:transcription-repair coupling factor (superfamily II helicase)
VAQALFHYFVYGITLFMVQNQAINSLGSLIDQIPHRNGSVECYGASGSERAYFIWQIYRELRIPIFVVAPSTKLAQSILEDLRFFQDTADVPLFLFPSYNILPFKFLAYHNETAARRISALYQLLEYKTPPIVVSSVDALLQKIIPKQEIINYAELIVAGEEIEREDLIEKLVSGGYVHASIVEEPGDFCVRGGIVDIYCPLYKDPLPLQALDEAIVLPAREMVLNKALLPQFISRIRSRASALEIPVSEIRKIVEPIKLGQGVPGIESLISLIYPELDHVFSYLPDDSLCVSIGDEDLERAASDSENLIAGNYEAACQAKKMCVEPSSLYLRWSQIKENRTVGLKFKAAIDDTADVSVRLKNYQEKENLLKPLADWIDEQRIKGLTPVMVCRTKTQAERLKSLLTPYGFRFRFAETFANLEIEPDTLYLCLGQLSSGFVWAAKSLAIITEAEIFGLSPRRRKPMRPSRPSELMDFQDLKKDDLIVHIDHGIGRYEGLVKLKIDGLSNDFLLLVEIYGGGRY